MVFAIEEAIAAKKAKLVPGVRVRVSTPILNGREGVIVTPRKYMDYQLSPDCLVQIDGMVNPLSFYQHEVELL